MRKGFIDWLKAANPDVICIQETKANQDQVELAEIEAAGYPIIIGSVPKERLQRSGNLHQGTSQNVVYGTGIRYAWMRKGVTYGSTLMRSRWWASICPVALIWIVWDHKLTYMADFQTYVDTLKRTCLTCHLRRLQHLSSGHRHSRPCAQCQRFGVSACRTRMVDRFIKSGFIDSFSSFK